MDKTAIRDAATVILLRDGALGPAVLMGQRSATAAFMPSKFVFPGGAVDRSDAQVPFAAPLNATCAGRLRQNSGLAPDTLAAAAIRELFEETGQRLSRPGSWPLAPLDWLGFAAGGHLPDASALRFIFRAITPPGNPRRFDARFFLADALALATDPDDFSLAAPELSALHWVPLASVRSLALPLITRIVLAELSAMLRGEGATAVPFLRHDDAADQFTRPEGQSPLEGA